jgi:hypothetical protein
MAFFLRARREESPELRLSTDDPVQPATMPRPGGTRDFDFPVL